MRRLHVSSYDFNGLLSYFLFQYLKYETNKVAVRILLSVRIYPTLPYMYWNLVHVHWANYE